MLPYARALADSLREHEPQWSLEVALIGSPPRRSGEEALRVVSVGEELDIDVEALLARHGRRELVSVLVPRLLERRCATSSEAWLHLPASVWVLGSLAPLAALVKEHCVLLARRAGDDPPGDGLEPSREQFVRMGRIAPDLIGVDGSPQSRSFLSWWTDHLDAELGKVDGHPRGHDMEDWEWLLRRLELAPARFSTAVLDDPGSNLSVWNLHEHSLVRTPTGVRVDGQWPPRFMDLAGFDPDHPYRLSETSSRVRLSQMPVLGELSQQYAQKLLEFGWREVASRVGIGGRLANGVVFDETMSSVYAMARDLGEDFGDLSSTEGTEAFMAWLNQPIAPWESEGITRYIVHRVMGERPDVAAAFPNLYGNDSHRFAAWWRATGSRELPVTEQLLLPGQGASEAADSPSHGAESRRARARRAKTEHARPRHPSAAVDLAMGVRVAGYLGHTLGLGSAARGYISALEAADIPLSTVSIPLDHVQAPVELSPDYGRHSYADAVSEAGHAFDLICVNADELPNVIERLGEDYFRGPRIAVWGWETNSIPRRWERAFGLIDEIWVYSRFMAENIGAASPVPVIALPPPVQAPSRNRGPLRLGVPSGFLFLFVFDYLSTIQRKNPVGLIEAFKQAFTPGEGPHLLIKTINAPLRPLAEEEVLWAAAGRSDIHVIDRSLTIAEKDAVMMACDCYVSLHRSEGFGLTMAEAMAIGKPVIGTRYSGNVDFMTDENSFLVDYEITRVGPDCEIYPADGEWAAPDLGQAAELMRRTYEQPDEAARRGSRARQDIARALSPEAAGAAMRRRLEELSGVTAGRGASAPR
jgi:glycosyltransferase involved in cell wall biosynthesis